MTWKTVPALREGERRFWDAIGRLYGRTLGPALKDQRVRGAAFGLTSPATLGALRGAGLSLEQASDLIGDVWVARLASRANRDRGRSS